MTNTVQPNKQQVRDWMAKRREERAPPPTPSEVRRQLGWGMLQAQRVERSR